MAEVKKINLDQNPNALTSLAVDAVIVITHIRKQIDWLNEGIRCLDWSLGHQLRRAKDKLKDLPIFVPSMGKITSQYVILCFPMSEKRNLEENCRNLSLKSLAIVADFGSVPEDWVQWETTDLDSIYVCDAVSQIGGNPI
ncbi:hypothetical protein EBQ74_08670 [bacterium]|nr:hypothetical protein [bacterium]